MEKLLIDKLVENKWACPFDINTQQLECELYVVIPPQQLAKFNDSAIFVDIYL